ncbi:MAG: flavin reductase [Ectothiorhodospiraceae bacterium]|nr:flavin reductase [Ectothiorhodospiraceae bacterium]
MTEHPTSATGAAHGRDGNRAAFIEGMSHAASTVSVVTTDGPHGRSGVTVSAMCSVSADPPSLLVCVHHRSRAAETIRANGVLCVNLLRDEQVRVSDTFAGRLDGPGGDRFGCAEWATLATGAPVLVDALVAFDCSVRHVFQWGSHLIFVAEVRDLAIHDTGLPLIYANRAYGTALALRGFAPCAPAPVGGRGGLDVGCFVTLGPFLMPRLLAGFLHLAPEIDVHLHEGTQDALVKGLVERRFELALLYDVGLGASVEVEPLADVAPHVLLPEGHPLAREPALTLAALASEPMVLLDIAPSRDYVRGLFRDAGLEPTIRFLSPSFEMVRGMVAHGFGYSLLVTKPANSMSYDGQALVSRPIADPVRPGRVVVAHAAQRPLSSAARRFVTHCRTCFERDTLPDPTPR